MSPKSMLHEIGIRPNRKQRAEIEAQEGDSVDVMSAQVIDSLFTDEQTALTILGSNLDRVASSIEKISNCKIFKKGKIERVAELGGGAGLICTWLSLNGCAKACDVYDHADNPLKWGQKWANDLKAVDVTFQKNSYAELSTTDVGKYDFVFAEFAVSFDHKVANDTKLDDFLNPEKCPLLEKYRELAGAIKSLTAADGEALVGGGFISPPSAVALCHALRESGLVIDWLQSSYRNGFQLFIKPKGIHLLEAAEDDALALMSDVVEVREFAFQDVLSLEKSFRGNKVYVDVKSENDNHQYRCTVVQAAGLAGLFMLGSNGTRSAKFFSAGRIPELAKNILKDASERRITSQYIEPRLAQII
jgi:hypothetical protein